MSDFIVEIIDFQAIDAPQLLVKSLKDTGFAVIHNHQIDKKLIDVVYSEWADFFNSKNEDFWP